MRNLLHYLIGAVIGILLFLTFDGISIPIQIFYTVFIMGVIGTMWEWGWQMYNKSFIDYIDVLRGAVGALLTVLILNLWIN
jgi:hypothetical protein